MANRVTEIGRILRAGEVELARRRVRRALERSLGNVRAAARLLDVDDNTIWRWIYRLALEDVVVEIRDRPGGNRAGVHAGGKLGRASTRVDGSRKSA